jgi:hypothetical protein
VADAYANGHFFAIRYVEWAGERWTVVDVEVQPPRLLFVWGRCTMASRLTLQTLLEGLRSMYISSLQPAFRWSIPAFDIRETIELKYAGNRLYTHINRYQVTVIDRNPDSELPDQVVELPFVRSIDISQQKISTTTSSPSSSERTISKMTALAWDQTGERFFETGVDRGVLYIPDESGDYVEGFAWNGLTTVTESPSGAEANPQYADNVKYLTLMSAEEFGATIEAFTYPDEFGQCDGTAEPAPGVKLGQQVRRQFGLAYRTKVGNDLDGSDHGYKLHLVYGAWRLRRRRRMPRSTIRPRRSRSRGS